MEANNLMRQALIRGAIALIEHDADPRAAAALAELRRQLGEIEARIAAEAGDGEAPSEEAGKPAAVVIGMQTVALSAERG